MDLDEWRTRPSSELQSYAQSIAESHADLGVRFEGIEADTDRRSAFFDVRGTRFALVPGGTVSLGFDVEAFEPEKSLLKSYSRSARAFGFPRSLKAHLKQCLLPRRTVTLRSVLVEVDAQQAGYVPVATSDPRIAALLARKVIRGSYEEAGRFRIEKAVDGSYRAWVIRATSRDALQRSLADDGFRLLTSDEWELACSAGKATLFRWGDSCPADFGPLDEVVLNRAVLEAALGRGAADVFSLHRAPNWFGLRIAEDPYHSELVCEASLMRGGDGGEAICGDYGEFLSWLPLASAYARPVETSSSDRDITGTWYRRAFDLRLPSSKL